MEANGLEGEAFAESLEEMNREVLVALINHANHHTELDVTIEKLNLLESSCRVLERDKVDSDDHDQGSDEPVSVELFLEEQGRE